MTEDVPIYRTINDNNSNDDDDNENDDDNDDEGDDEDVGDDGDDGDDIDGFLDVSRRRTLRWKPATDGNGLIRRDRHRYRSSQRPETYALESLCNILCVLMFGLVLFWGRVLLFKWLIAFNVSFDN